jgi:nucleoside-diphosphate-sugar epimerase
MRVFVTGASGFVGRRLVEMLLEAGHAVIAHDLRLAAEVDIVDNVPQGSESPSLKVVAGDLVKAEGLESVGECDAVVHLAAAGVKASSRQWELCTSVNVTGTQALLSVIGRCPDPPVLFFPRTFYQDHLTEVPALWENPYIATKEAATRLVERWMAQDRPDARIVIGTFFQAYGPGDDPNNLVNYAIRRLKAGEPAQFGSGTALRDWIYVDDLVDAVVASIQNIRGAGRPHALRCDIGTGHGYSALEVVGKIAHLLGVEAKASFDSSKDRSDSGISAAAKSLAPDWQPRYPLEAGLRLSIESIA